MFVSSLDPPRTPTRGAARAAGALLASTILASPLCGHPFTSSGTQPGLEIPLAQPGDCFFCHGDFDPMADHEPGPSWSGSMMAQAGRDPLFWASLDIANDDSGGLAGDFCLRCHAPTAWLAGRTQAPDGTGDGCSLIGALDEADNDFQGLSCAVCHRMMVNTSPPEGEDEVYLENGQFWIDDENCPGDNEPCRRGPYDYLDGARTPPHAWDSSGYHTSSRICGNCHNVTSPNLTLIDENGTDTGIAYPIERTYAEWEVSAFGDVDSPEHRPCQSCHMPDAVQGPVSPCRQDWNDRTGDLPVHRFAGGGAWMSEVPEAELGSLDRSAELLQAADDSRSLLAEAATLEILAPAGALPGHALETTVRVVNHSGHKLPTGYPEGRRMWLEVIARDGNDLPFWSVGTWDALEGELDDGAQLYVFEAKPGLWDFLGTDACDTHNATGEALFHFVLNDCFQLDNRIPPAGFRGGDDPSIRPVGVTYPETAPDSGVLVHWADVDFAIPIPFDVVPPIHLETRLLYQTTSPEYVEFLRDRAVDRDYPNDCIPRSDGLLETSRGAYLADLWQNHGRSTPIEMVAAGAEVRLGLFMDGFETGTTEAWEPAG